MSLSWGLQQMMRQHLSNAICRPSSFQIHSLGSFIGKLRDWHLAFLSPIKMANIYYYLKKVSFFICQHIPTHLLSYSKVPNKRKSTIHRQKYSRLIIKAHFEANGGQWRSMEINGGQWRSMEVNGGQWSPMETKGGQWRPMEAIGGQWRSIEVN